MGENWQYNISLFEKDIYQELLESFLFFYIAANIFIMANQQISAPKKKKSYWLLLPFIAIAVMLAIKFGYSGKHADNSGNKISATTSRTEATDDSSISASSFTNFPPEELSEMMKKYSSNYVAGECTSKGCYEYKDIWEFKSVGQRVYSYYLGHVDGCSNKDCLIKYMDERVTPLDYLHCIHFTIKSKDKYEKYKAYLDKVKQDSITGNKKIYSDCDHYVFNSAVFIDRGYLIDFKGYVIEVYSLNKFGNYRTNKS